MCSLFVSLQPPPTAIPSKRPSILPSTTPSQLPTIKPSQFPSRQPSLIPTTVTYYWSVTSAPTAQWRGLACDANCTHIYGAPYDPNPYRNISMSSDGGYTWFLTGPQSRWQSTASSSSGQYVIITAESGYPYTSSDYGATWKANTAVGAGNYLTAASSRDGSYIALAKSNSYMYMSSDYGASWYNSGTVGSNGWAFTQAVAMNSNGSFLLGAQSGVNAAINGSLYTSSDYGMCIV